MQGGAAIYISDSGTWRMPAQLTLDPRISSANEAGGVRVQPARRRRLHRATAQRAIAMMVMEAPILHAPALAQMAITTRLALAAATQRVFLPDLLGAA